VLTALAGPAAGAGGGAEGDSLRDADVIFAHQKLRTLNPSVDVLTELMVPGNMAFLGATQPLHGVGAAAPLLLPAYASGQVFLASFLDSLVVQSFYNRGSNRILSKLLLGWQGSSEGGVGPSRTVLLHIDLAASQHGCSTFGQLFQHLLEKRSMLCLGLYRAAYAQGASAPSFRYVVTRPKPEAALRAGDQAMVRQQAAAC
jgi:hypothetical protein